MPPWRRNGGTVTVAVKAPAVIGALDAVVFDFAAAERTATVCAGIAQAMDPVLAITPEHEVLTQHAKLSRLVTDILTLLRGIPEIYKHIFFLQSVNSLLTALISSFILA
jgi:hypothetical protein